MAWYNDALKYGAPILGAGAGFMAGGPMGAMIGYGAGSAIGGMAAGSEQAKNAEQAAAETRSSAEAERARLIAAGERGAEAMEQYGGEARGYIEGYGRSAEEGYDEGYYSALSRLQGGADASRGYMDEGYVGAMQALGAGYDQGVARLDPVAALAQYGEQAVATPVGEGFETDPGYAFRLQQGSDALSSMQAASGGRLSGEALKKAMEYNQGFASNEYQNYANRDLARRQMMMNLGATGYNALGRQAQLDVDRGSGLAALQSNYGAGMANLETGYASNMANLDAGRASALSSIRSGTGANIANALMQTGAGVSNAYQGASSQAGGLYGSVVAPTYSMALPYQQSAYNAYQGGMNNMANMAMFGYGSGMFGGGSATPQQTAPASSGLSPQQMAMLSGNSFQLQQPNF